MTQYKQWFIDVGFERYYHELGWYLFAWSGSFLGKSSVEIVAGLVTHEEMMGQEIESVAGIRILGLYVRIGVRVTTYNE